MATQAVEVNGKVYEVDTEAGTVKFDEVKYRINEDGTVSYFDEVGVPVERQEWIRMRDNYAPEYVLGITEKILAATVAARG